MTAATSPSFSIMYSTYLAQRISHSSGLPISMNRLWMSGGGTCSVPHIRGPMPLRNTVSPLKEIVSRVAPWKESHMEIVLYLPVAMRASFIAMELASAPPGAKSTLSRFPGASDVNFLAKSTATWLVYRRGQKGKVSSCFCTAAMTSGLP